MHVLIQARFQEGLWQKHGGIWPHIVFVVNELIENISLQAMCGYAAL